MTASAHLIGLLVTISAWLITLPRPDRDPRLRVFWVFFAALIMVWLGWFACDVLKHSLR